MFHTIRNSWEQVCKRNYWICGLLTALLPLSYIYTRNLFTTIEPEVYVTASTLTVNMILTFMVYGASCPIIAKRLNWKPIWGYVLLIPAFLGLIFLFSMFGAQTRW